MIRSVFGALVPRIQAFSSPVALVRQTARHSSDHDAPPDRKDDWKWTTGHDIDKHELHQLLNHPWNVVLLDVREPDEYNAGFIPMAVNLPGTLTLSALIAVGELEAALKSNHDAFQRAYGFDLPAKDRRVVVYCKVGGRSEMALRIMRRLGYERVRNYRGSWMDWNAPDEE